VTEPEQAPKKLFREEAQTSTVSCLSCGGPITLRGFGAVERVSCPYCGSVLAPEESGALQLLQQVQRDRRQSVLPLHARGKLDGTTWEIIGTIWRYSVADGESYPWQELLLFNPYRGYRWLIYSMYDGQWSIGGALDGAPKPKHGAARHRSLEFGGQAYRHFQTSTAITDYVEGEFPWQVQVGDQALAHEYIAPPTSISVEESADTGGHEVNFTKLSYIEPREVWAAFGMQGTPPRRSGIGSIQPNPWAKEAKVMWLSMLVLVLVWIAATAIYASSRDRKVLVDEMRLGVEPFTREVVIGEPGEKTTVDVTFSADPLSNSWAYADIMLVAQEREEAIGFGVEVDEWHGVSEGEAWREGSGRRTTVVGGVEGGKYLLQVTPQVTPKAKVPATSMSIRVREDILLLRYILLPFALILAFPILVGFLKLIFEGRRWQNSDYAPSED
jgi:ribosomal protein S27E